MTTKIIKNIYSRNNICLGVFKIIVSMKRGYGGILEYIEKCVGFVGMLFYDDYNFKKS